MVRKFYIQYWKVSTGRRLQASKKDLKEEVTIEDWKKMCKETEKKYLI